MITIRKSQERGHADFGWLNSYHTFSFGEYYDERFMGFRHLRVINEDRVGQGGGFDTHPHRDMEIISYVIDGELAHKDSMGTGSIIRSGDVQVMSAGSGVAHSEFNYSKKNPVYFLQIWIFPDKKGLTPSYQQKSFSADDKKDKLCLIVADEKSKPKGALTIHQDVKLYASQLTKGKDITFVSDGNRYGWIQLIKGELEVGGTNNVLLNAGDGAFFEKEAQIKISAQQDAEFLLFDLN